MIKTDPLSLITAVDRSRVATTTVTTAECGSRSEERESKDSNDNRTSVHV